MINPRLYFCGRDVTLRVHMLQRIAAENVLEHRRGPDERRWHGVTDEDSFSDVVNNTLRGLWADPNTVM